MKNVKNTILAMIGFALIGSCPVKMQAAWVKSLWARCSTAGWNNRGKVGFLAGCTAAAAALNSTPFTVVKTALDAFKKRLKESSESWQFLPVAPDSTAKGPFWTKTGQATKRPYNPLFADNTCTLLALEENSQSLIYGRFVQAVVKKCIPRKSAPEFVPLSQSGLPLGLQRELRTRLKQSAPYHSWQDDANIFSDFMHPLYSDPIVVKHSEPSPKIYTDLLGEIVHSNNGSAQLIPNNRKATIERAKQNSMIILGPGVSTERIAKNLAEEGWQHVYTLKSLTTSEKIIAPYRYWPSFKNNLYENNPTEDQTVVFSNRPKE